VVDDEAWITIGADLARLYLSEYWHRRYRNANDHLVSIV
jgi:hypothetical protein